MPILSSILQLRSFLLLNTLIISASPQLVLQPLSGRQLYWVVMCGAIRDDLLGALSQDPPFSSKVEGSRKAQLGTSLR